MSRRLQRIKEAGALTAAVLSYPPFADLAYHSERCVGSAAEQPAGATAFGIQVRLISEAASANGLSVTYRSVGLHQLENVFGEFGADCMFPVFPSPGREKFGVVVACTHETGLGAIALSEQKRLSSIDQVFQEMLTVCVASGEVGDEFIMDWTRERNIQAPRVTRLEASKLNQLQVLIRERIADIAIVDALTCHRIVKKSPEFIHLFRDVPLKRYPTGILVPHHDEEYRTWLEKIILDQFGKPSFRAFEALELRDLQGIAERR